MIEWFVKRKKEMERGVYNNGDEHLGKKKISRESLTMRKKRVSCMYIYIDSLDIS